MTSQTAAIAVPIDAHTAAWNGVVTLKWWWCDRDGADDGGHLHDMAIAMTHAMPRPRRCRRAGSRVSSQAIVRA